VTVSESVGPATDGLLVYGVVPADATLPRLAGPAGQLDAVPCGRVAAVVSSVPLDRPLARRDDLTAFHDAVNALAAHGPVVPVRFGSVLLDESDVAEEFLAPREDELVALLEALESRSQLTLRARYVEDVVLAEIVASDRRIQQLNERTRGLSEEESWADRVRLGELVAHALEERRQQDAAQLLDLVLPLAVEHREHGGAGADHVLEAALLVDDDRHTELEQALEEYAATVHARIRISLVGPLAPYDFVGAS
jgi:hypothetical protein